MGAIKKDQFNMPFKSAFQPEVQSVHQVCNLTRNSKDGSRTFFFEILEAVHCTVMYNTQEKISLLTIHGAVSTPLGVFAKEFTVCKFISKLSCL